MTKNKQKEKLNEVVTFRLSQSEFAPYKKIISKTGHSKSLVMREVFISKADNAQVPEKVSKDNKRLLFLANKASNNINQLAHRINLDNQKGKINEKTYKLLLNNLINIERHFVAAAEKC